MYRAAKNENKDKQRFYEFLQHELLNLVEFEDEWLSALANAAALLGHQLDDINWAGFYLLRDRLLVLGPFQGKPACSAIVMGHGVCGTAAAEGKTIVVPDVHQFPGHIACDEASRSEIVIPLVVSGIVRGVLDIDSPVVNRFVQEDIDGLKLFVEILQRHVPWPAVKF